MINLLPPHAKKSITREYWVRVCTVWAMVCAFAFAGISFVFLPVYVLINSQVEAYSESATVASEKIADYENVTKSLIRASQEAKTTIAYTNLPTISEQITLIDRAQGETVKLESVAISRATDGFAPIQISGIADNRQALASFRDRLLAHDSFVAVDLPIANLAKDRDIPFSITVTVASKKTP